MMKQTLFSRLGCILFTLVLGTSSVSLFAVDGGNGGGINKAQSLNFNSPWSSEINTLVRKIEIGNFN